MSSNNTVGLPKAPDATEWPTLAIIVLVYFAFTVLTLNYHALPWWLTMPLAGYILALFGSLQHEVLHGHPTPRQWLNELLIFPSLVVWIPYPVYKESHLTHHNDQNLTDPKVDPESYYQEPHRWAFYPRWVRSYYYFYNTFTGRLLWGPVHLAVSLFYREFFAMMRGDVKKIQIWILHLISCALVFYWVSGICRIPWYEYLIFFVYPGLSLTLMRSYLEHEAVARPEHRSVIVESNPIISLMFLNNNLHAIHHKHPGMSWYTIAQMWKSERTQVLSENNNYYYKGYGNIAWRYGFTAKENPCYPLNVD